ncbi:esterase/lipase family protein [Rhodococcus artemisiae]|uniref:Lipase n=1 Tax=Rhodococcus artemisiae TaxID=714159 RepID=A0ABU7LFF7_9NOCA|nr:alpha/beta fold hydrolase [Rhodococcus artemisiae]MEE2060294.1 lipase [Rhodococcus artemisiae]
MFSRALPVLGATAIALAITPTALAQDPLPVPYDHHNGVVVELTNPGGSPAGANIPCTSAQEPVVLVHNTSGNKQIGWQTLAPLLANEGRCVVSFTYGEVDGPWPIDAVGGLGPIDEAAHELAVFVDEVLAQTGAEQVDVVGHSQGTLVPSQWVQFQGGADKVADYVSLAPMWHGTDVFGSETPDAVRPALEAACPACADMLPGSPFLERLRNTGIFDPSIDYTNILTSHDQTVVPYTSGYAEAPNVTNIVLQDVCPSSTAGHLGLLADPTAAELVLRALDDHSPIDSASCGQER